MKLFNLFGKLPLTYIFVCFVLLTTDASAASQIPILILHSYSEEYPWTKRQHEGFLEALATAPGLTPNYSVEYLDSKRRTYNDHYGSQFADYLRFKYIGYRPALIYTTDDDALLFARQFSNMLFPGTPVFFSGINDSDILNKLDPAKMTGVFEKKDIATNLKLLMQMDPSLHGIVLIGDGSTTYQAIVHDARSELEKLPNIKAIFIAEKRLDRLLDRLSGQTETYLFLTTMGRLTDENGQTLSLSQSIPEIVQLGRFVILSMEDVYMFKGVLGGFVTSGRRQGETAGLMALAYLNGTPITQLAPVQVSPNEYLFDQGVLEQHKLFLPAGIRAVSKIVNHEPNFYQRHTTVVIVSIGVLSGLLFLTVLASLFILSRKNRLIRRINATLEQRVQLEVAGNREKDQLIIQQSRFAAMGEMIGNIAHQWRQPLNALGLVLANIEDAYHYNELTQEYLVKQVAVGKQYVQNMSSTIDDFRNFFRPHKATEPFSVTNAIEKAVALVAASFQSHNIDIRHEAGGDATIDGFPNEYSQVLLNLLVNAKEAILTRPEANGRVNISLTCDSQYATVIIADNGGGIPATVLDKIFEPYFSTKEMGTGIGLYMSKIIIEKSMHGRLSVSNQGNGAEFAIQCPLSRKPSKQTHENAID